MLVVSFQTHWSLGLKRNYDTPRFPYFGLMTDWGSTRNRGASASAQASLLIPIWIASRPIRHALRGR